MSAHPVGYYLPAYVSPRLASAITRRSDKAIRRLLTIGVLSDRGPGTRAQIPLADIERLLGRSIDPLEYLLAERSLDPYRQRQRAYNETRDGPAAA